MAIRGIVGSWLLVGWCVFMGYAVVYSWRTVQALGPGYEHNPRRGQYGDPFPWIVLIVLGTFALAGVVTAIVCTYKARRLPRQ